MYYSCRVFSFLKRSKSYSKSSIVVTLAYIKKGGSNFADFYGYDLISLGTFVKSP
jgi:hypothetical protein